MGDLVIAVTTWIRDAAYLLSLTAARGAIRAAGGQGPRRVVPIQVTERPTLPAAAALSIEFFRDRSTGRAPLTT